MDFPMWTGSGGNALDFVVESVADTRKILSAWADSCIAAYQINTNACRFAAKSMKESNPSADILSRINSIASKLAQKPSLNNTNGDSFYLFEFTDVITNDLDNDWYDLANFVAEAEDAVIGSSSQQKRALDARAGNLNYASYNWSSPTYGKYNPFITPALMCIDNNYTGISTEATFISYLQKQIAQDILTGYLYSTFSTASCLTWPNFTNANNVERYSTTFPTLNSKMLFIEFMHTTSYSAAGVFSTYKFVGSQNANILLHDGYESDLEADNCTINAMTDFLSHGNIFPSISR